MSSGTRSSTSDGTGGIRYFSDESEDYKEYRRCHTSSRPSTNCKLMSVGPIGSLACQGPRDSGAC